MYNAEDFFVREVMKTCSDEQDCATKCVQETKCNWAPMGSKLSSAECLNMFPSQTQFCKDPEGARWGMPSKTKEAVCETATVKVLEPWETFMYTDPWNYGDTTGTSDTTTTTSGTLTGFTVTNSDCTAIGDGSFAKTFRGYFDMDMSAFETMTSSGGGMTDMDFSVPEMKPVYTCGKPSATTKSVCLSDCLGATGFQPNAMYRCERPVPDSGACPQHWQMESPPMEFDAMGNPVFAMPVCVPADVYGAMGANTPYTGFTDGVKNNHYYPWDYSWFTEAGRCAELSSIAGLEDVVEKQMDDGEGECYMDRCYFDATASNIADYSACMAKVPSNEQHNYWFDFRGSWKNGAGVCSILRADGWGDQVNDGSSGRPRTGADLNAFRSKCTQFGGVFYMGKRFEEPLVDTQTKCSGQTECEIDMGYKVTGLSMTGPD
eukprot:g20447.t1